MNVTDFSLLEQMRFTDHEIEARKELFSITEQDLALMRSCRDVVRERIDVIVREFYEIQIKQDDVALVIGDKETLDRLRAAMRVYILEMFEGIIDAQYVARRLRVGKVHKQIGVTPKLYMAAIRLLLTVLGKHLDSYARGLENCGSCSSVREVVGKILLFDAQLVFDTYISSMVNEVNLARHKAEEYAVNLEQKIAERTHELKDLSRRDGLTGLLNQRAFYEALRQAMFEGEHLKQSTALIYFDLNGFKKLNDTQGHREGDRILALVSTCIGRVLPVIGTACRYGGDEFCIILPNSTAEAARKLCETLSVTFTKACDVPVTFSMGIAVTQVALGEDADMFVRRADAAMYQAKALARQDGQHHTAMFAE